MQKLSSARFTRPKHVDIELVAVAYRNRKFPVHVHEQYVIGAIETGAEILRLEGKQHVVGEGHLITLNPGQAHSNCSIGDEMLEYRVFYTPSELVEAYTGRPDLCFMTPSRRDLSASQRLLSLHRWFEQDIGDRLEQESATAEIIEIAFEDAGRSNGHVQPPQNVGKAKCYIDRHYRESFGLDAVAEVAGVTKSHLVRRFKNAYGLSPFAYRTQRRIHEAKRLVLEGTPLAEIAAELGFSDQSHLTRQFQSTVGISPARYREQ
ncbi:helix-turn-helix transcriptional regulator [Sphingomicrobium aestuariivivum]|uniref:helix-turn-helix transcriptional regulator n=1 Tax=Sphingomicrobium aestuariivivum TaxID=1582356 RepID=UPI001FD6ADF6|nr:AraC family transcriptional regulator [Sphingomicrobium aestuariivivum]MCJ8190031.1 AraC family transcriptional regulator [Sphingomicrobium aestuariivivum]